MANPAVSTASSHKTALIDLFWNRLNVIQDMMFKLCRRLRCLMLPFGPEKQPLSFFCIVVSPFMKATSCPSHQNDLITIPGGHSGTTHEGRPRGWMRPRLRGSLWVQNNQLNLIYH